MNRTTLLQDRRMEKFEDLLRRCPNDGPRDAVLGAAKGLLSAAPTA